jgi:hypothetical protein
MRPFSSGDGPFVFLVLSNTAKITDWQVILDPPMPFAQYALSFPTILIHNPALDKERRLFVDSCECIRITSRFLGA